MNVINETNLIQPGLNTVEKSRSNPGQKSLSGHRTGIFKYRCPVTGIPVGPGSRSLSVCEFKYIYLRCKRSVNIVIPSIGANRDIIFIIYIVYYIDFYPFLNQIKSNLSPPCETRIFIDICPTKLISPNLVMINILPQQYIYGDIFELKSDVDPNWWHVVVPNSSLHGEPPEHIYVPATYVERIADSYQSPTTNQGEEDEMLPPPPTEDELAAVLESPMESPVVPAAIEDRSAVSLNLKSLGQSTHSEEAGFLRSPSNGSSNSSAAGGAPVIRNIRTSSPRPMSHIPGISAGTVEARRQFLSRQMSDSQLAGPTTSPRQRGGGSLKIKPRDLSSGLMRDSAIMTTNEVGNSSFHHPVNISGPKPTRIPKELCNYLSTS
eukprot:sb/3465705/